MTLFDCYRTSAVIYTGFRFIGDVLTQDSKPGVLTRFLTGTDVAGSVIQIHIFQPRS